MSCTGKERKGSGYTRLHEQELLVLIIILPLMYIFELQDITNQFNINNFINLNSRSGACDKLPRVHNNKKRECPYRHTAEEVGRVHLSTQEPLE